MALISAATEISYVSCSTIIMRARDGDLTVKAYDPDFSDYIEIEGSPILDGESRRITEPTGNGLLEITPSTTDVGMTYELVRGSL